MQLDVIIETMRSMPVASFTLVLFMSISAALLINHILQAGYYTTLASIPVLLVAGMFGNALLMVNNITLSPDKASNTALAASFGFILCAGMCFGAVRVWSRIHDRR